MEQFAVEEVMNRIRREIRDKGLRVDELSYISPYHNRMMKRLKLCSELVIFGAGEYGKTTLEDLERYGISTVKCVCDNDKHAAGREMRGYKVLSPEEALETYPNACFVITPMGYENEILIQLVHMGVKIENAVVFNLRITGLEDD